MATSFVVEQLKARHVDIVHVQTDFAVGIAGSYAARKLGLPLVYTFHTLLWKQVQTRNRSAKLAIYVFEKPLQWRIKPDKYFALTRLPGEPLYAYKARRHSCLVASKADIIISPSTHMAKRFHEWLPRSEIIVSPNFVTTPIRSSALPDIPTFLWMGRMMPEKRVLDFCRALELVASDTTKPFRATIIGNGYHLDDVRAWAEDKPYVTVIGSVPNNAVHEYIDHSSALVMTSYGFDNQPMVIAESVVAGRGIVSTDPDLLLDIDPEAGAYPADASPEGLAQVLTDLIERPSRLVSMAVAAQRSAPIFSEQKGCERLIAAYKAALARSHPTLPPH
jgi:glycosyltransferase involved in cell wall biosynthesis